MPSAIPLLAAAAKKSYRYEDDPIRLGLKALEEGRIDEARNYFNEAITNEHQVYRAHYGMAELLSVQADYANAEPLYRQAIIEKGKETGSPDFPEAHVGLGTVLLRLQRAAEAKQEFEQALSEKGNLWEAQYGLARIAIEDGKLDDALALLDKGAKKKGFKEREDLYRYGMGLVQFKKDDLLSAEKNALAAFAINPNDPDYGTLVAEIYTKRGARTLAIDAYVKALETPGLMVTAPVHHRLGVLYQEEKRYNDALEQYKQAVRMDSTYAPAVKDMASLYALANRNEEAATAFLAYSRLRPDDSAGFSGFAEACSEDEAKQAGSRGGSAGVQDRQHECGCPIDPRPRLLRQSGTERGQPSLRGRDGFDEARGVGLRADRTAPARCQGVRTGREEPPSCAQDGLHAGRCLLLPRAHQSGEGRAGFGRHPLRTIHPSSLRRMRGPG